MFLLHTVVITQAGIAMSIASMVKAGNAPATISHMVVLMDTDSEACLQDGTLQVSVVDADVFTNPILMTPSLSGASIVQLNWRKAPRA